MGYFCPQCYAEKMMTVALAQDGELFHCPINPKHVFRLDEQGFPRRVK